MPSKRLWEVRDFGISTLDHAFRALKLAATKDLSYRDAVCWIGACVEKLRQCGTKYYGSKDMGPVENHWRGAIRSNHRYARGKNAVYYRVAGANLLSELAGCFGLDPGTPAPIVWDSVCEAVQ